MNIFLKNRNFRQLLINQWISGFGDIVFYLALMNYVSAYSFAPLAIFIISVSETLPQFIQVFTGVVADFQKNRTQKYLFIQFSKVVLYSLVTLLLFGRDFSFLILLVICLINFLSDSLSYFSGAMLTPVYIKVIEQDMTSAMGFRQASMSLVHILGNLAGGFLITWMSIGALAGLNTLTFVLAYLGFRQISKNLHDLEPTLSNDKELTKANYWKHLLASLKVLLGLKDVVRLLLISSLGQVILNILTPVATLLLLKKTFGNLQVGQSLALLIVFSSAGLILGNILSGSLLKKLSTKLAMYASQLFEGFILCGFFLRDFLLVLIATFACAVVVGLLSPRLQKSVFSLIPEESMGSIQSAINLFSMAVPGILSMLLIALASSMGISYILLPLVLMLLLSFWLIIPMGDLDTDS
ncbi:MFS transporter [Streptococcus sinensis]|uniref:Major facilitator family transporter n=1 Tax=Streptococcus sinensis TaxID=176090 RepID=A0A0A0DLZ8_9STRE|nr:MFS transporter [Streptococcus sinensis]KGM37967.1 major facilitator family transporter [Streptococcus sinensis]